LELCIECKKRLIVIKSRKLCRGCYQALRRNNNLYNPEKALTRSTQQHVKAKREIEFIKNHFKHTDWLHEPAMFYLEDNSKYTPDFYDQRENIFIEVIGSRQAYHANKHKYKTLRKLYPMINFEIRTTDGELLNEVGRIAWPLITNS